MVRHNDSIDRTTVPDPYETYGQFLRYHHLDLEHLLPSELRRECDLMRWILAREPKPHPWYAERLQEARAEMRRRRPPKATRTNGHRPTTTTLEVTRWH